jgi:hypothetical protein
MQLSAVRRFYWETKTVFSGFIQSYSGCSKHTDLTSALSPKAWDSLVIISQMSSNNVQLLLMIPAAFSHSLPLAVRAKLSISIDIKRGFWKPPPPYLCPSLSMPKLHLPKITGTNAGLVSEAGWFWHSSLLSVSWSCFSLYLFVYSKTLVLGLKHMCPGN